MSIKVGIPRALLYYQYFPMWKTFFDTLGAEVVISAPTTKAILADGASRLVAETCLPVKVFCGHAASLAKQCDYLFVPSIRSIEARVFNCSKFLGLPDMIKAAVPESPPILDTEVDINKGPRSFWMAIYGLARHFTANPFLAKKATQMAMEAHRAFRKMMWRESLTVPQAFDSLYVKNKINTAQIPRKHRLKVALIGHSYLMHDEFINHRLSHRLETLGAQVFMPEMVSPKELRAAVLKLEDKVYWTHETEVVGAGGYYMSDFVDGVIGIAAFGCGPDSLMMDVVERYGRQHKTKPFMYLTIDEHSAEAGILTRLEAFLDMLARRKKQ